MESASRTAHVLVVEDDDFMRAYLRDALALAGHRVTEARDGEEALDAFASVRPELVVLDLLMPRRSGLDVLPRLLELCPEVRVVIVSSLDSQPLIADALAAGAFDFVTKPFHPTEIAEAVERALCEEVRP